MKAKLIAAAGICLLLGVPVSAHRLDEYLQATILSVEKEHVQASMRLIPGLAVSSAVIATIDSNADGVISEAEKWAYAKRVLSDLSLSVDGVTLRPRLVSVDFPQIQQMKEGLGEIHIEFTADLPPGRPSRRLILENHHESRSAAYLMNCLVPRDRDIRIVAQHRNEQQSFYQLDYVQADASLVSSGGEWWRASTDGRVRSVSPAYSASGCGISRKAPIIFCSCWRFCCQRLCWSLVRAGRASLAGARVSSEFLEL
jgi:hypothetical protein